MTRGDPSEDELEFSAEGICSNKVDDPVKARLKLYFKPLSEAYMKICKNQHREFFGLRDFYRYPTLNCRNIRYLYITAQCVCYN